MIVTGPIETPLGGKMDPSADQPAGLSEIFERLPLKRMGQPEEIAAAALYFASDDSRFTTSAELRVDGGFTLLARMMIAADVLPRAAKFQEFSSMPAIRRYWKPTYELALN